MKFLAVAFLGAASFVFADNCAQVHMKARPAANYYNYVYTVVKQIDYSVSGDRVITDQTSYFYWNGSTNEQVTDSVVNIDARRPENSTTFSKAAGTYALYKKDGSQGTLVSYSKGKKYEEGTIDYSGDTLVMQHVLYGDSKQALLYTIKMHISNDTLHFYHDSYTGYPDTIAYADTSRSFLIDNPEKENHCLQYYYSSDKNEWIKSTSDLSYEFKGDTLIYSNRTFNDSVSYVDDILYLVLNSVLFNQNPTKIRRNERKSYSTLPNKEKYRDVKGRFYSKAIPYRVLLGIGE
ncbi:MAG: hypothetical protein J6T54_10735 [Fibrobacter sp.]|nr:hypothetical protein [Fibrobacter sp.]